MTVLDLFFDSSRDVAMATDFMANLGTCVHSAERRLKTTCNIAIPFTNIQWQYVSYILSKHDENRSSNPRDYEGNKCTFLD